MSPPQDIYQNATSLLLDNSDLTTAQLQNALSSSLSFGGAWADIYLQQRKSESWSIEDNRIKHGGFSSHQGFGLRLVNAKGEAALAYADNLSLTALKEASQFVRALTSGTSAKVSHGERDAVLSLAPSKASSAALYAPIDPLATWSDTKKTALLQEINEAAFKLDSRVKQLIAQLSGSWETVLILDSEGRLATDIRPLVRLNITVWLEDPVTHRRESGFAGGGARESYDYFLIENCWQHYLKEAIRVADLNLQAVPVAADCMPVVLGAGWPGVLVHEAIGHGLEADFNRQQLSVYSDKLGKTIAAKGVNIIDRGNIPNRRGSLTIDDEGTPTQETLLVKDGVLVDYLYDRLNGQLMHHASTGNGRREAYNAMPIPRMTNTYLAPGDYDPQEIISSVSKGIYAVNFLGGQVDITSGDFVFTSSEAYLIENGKATTPIKGVTLIGQGSNVLKNITMVGNDWQLDEGVGTCGKAGQSVPVGVGMPTTKISQLQVGGSVLGSSS